MSEETPARASGDRRLTPAARRALQEAAARRAASTPTPEPKEIGGADRPDPTRFGDWELKGRAIDF